MGIYRLGEIGVHSGILIRLAWKFCFLRRWRRRTVDDDIKDCELFLRKERRHTEDNHPGRRRLNYAYRERSIDDGSHFDPRLDKYPEGTLRRSRESSDKSSAKVEKKKTGLEKVGSYNV